MMVAIVTHEGHYGKDLEVFVFPLVWHTAQPRTEEEESRHHLSFITLVQLECLSES